MKVFITKFALTSGIIETEGEVSSPAGVLVVENKSSSGGRDYYAAPYWRNNLEDAKKQANKMRDAKLKSLTKQVEKLKLLEF